MVIVEQACRLHDLSVRIDPVVRADVGKVVASPKGALMSEMEFYFTFHLGSQRDHPRLVTYNLLECDQRINGNAPREA